MNGVAHLTVTSAWRFGHRIRPELAFRLRRRRRLGPSGGGSVVDRAIG